jgi:hypothetical protein
MRPILTVCALATALAVTACQDSDQILSPNDPADALSFSIQQQVDRVAPGRILARLTDGCRSNVGGKRAWCRLRTHGRRWPGRHLQRYRR